MALTKLDQVKFPFFKETGAAGNSDIFNNNCYNMLTLEVSGEVSAVSLKVQGCVNIEDSNKQIIPDNQLEWTDLAVINLSNFSVISSITGKGIYAIGISGTSKIRVHIDSINGSASIIGVLEA